MNPSSQDYILYLQDVYQRYPGPDGKLFTVLNDIDFRARKGEFITVVGPSGCGKSTMLRLILGSEQAHSGTIHFQGETIPGPNRHRGIVFQKYSLFPHMTVLQNIVFGLESEAFGILGRILPSQNRTRLRQQHRDEANMFLDRIGLSGQGHKYPHQLSGGMRQRVAIAQALIMKPEILLMDEPFGALDDATRQEMQLFLLELWDKHRMTIFFVTHDLEEACFLGSRILVLSQFYSSDDPGQQGSKIVMDIDVKGDHPKSTKAKDSPEIRALINEIRETGLSSEYLQHLRDFNLSHPDAYRTVHHHEWTR